MPSRSFAAVVIFDDPECADAAAAFAALNLQLPSAPPADQVTTEVFLVPASSAKLNSSLAASSSGTNNNAASPSAHGEALVDALRGLVNYRPSELVVVGLLKDANASAASQRIREICADSRPPIAECHIATHLGNYNDMSLVVRNLVRRFHDAASRQLSPTK